MNGFYQITENELLLPGVRGEHVFLHISDTHVSVSDALSTDNEREKAEKQEESWQRQRKSFAEAFHEPFLPEHEIPSAEALHKFFAFAEKERPECLLLSGDILDYRHPAGFRLLEKELSGYGGEYLFVPGNHEGDYESHPELTAFNRGSAGVTVYHGDGFLVAALDDSGKTVSERQLEELRAISEGSIPTVLLTHIPIATAQNAGEMKRFGDYFSISEKSEDANARELVRLLSGPDCAVCAILCGHVHGYHSSVYAGDRRQICASSGLVGFVHRFTVRGI